MLLSLFIMPKIKIAFICGFILLTCLLYAQDEDSRPVKEIIAEALANPDTVTVLDLSDKLVDALPEDFAKLKNLKTLFLNRDNLTEIPPVIFKLKNLEALSITGWPYYDDDTNHHTLVRISPQIASLTKLHELNLESNSIHDLPQEFAKLRLLKLLYFNENSLNDSDMKVICKLDSLTSLDISANDLTRLPISFSNLKYLKYLLINNRWAEGCPVGSTMGFPKVICSLANLEILTMQGQAIDSLPVAIGNLKKLKVLDLYANSFLSMPESIGNLKELTDFNIDLLCLGSMSKLCDLHFYFPESICNLQKLKKFSFNSRSIAPKEYERIQKCLPKGLIPNKE